MSVNINAKLRIKGVTTGGGGGGNTPVTFITSKPVGQSIYIQVAASTGYWKYNHNGIDSNAFTSGVRQITVENANGEFTIIPCDNVGNPSGSITEMRLGGPFQYSNNQIISFNGTGLTGLTNLVLSNNQLTSFNGTGLTGLTTLYLTNNQLTSVNVSGLTNLTTLYLTNNQLDSSDNDSILSQLVANGRNNGYAETSGGRTSAGTNDFNTLSSRSWVLIGFNDNTTTTTTTLFPSTTTTTTMFPGTTTTTTQNNQYFTVGGQSFNPSDVSFYLTNTLNNLSAQLGTTVYLAARRAIDGQYSVLDPNNMYRTMTTIFAYPMNLIPVWTETLPSLPSGTYYLYYFELVDSNGNRIYRYPMTYSRP